MSKKEKGVGRCCTSVMYLRQEREVKVKQPKKVKMRGPNICVYTTEQKLLHKQDKLVDDIDKSDIGEYYWFFFHMPKINIGAKFYFATKFYIRGYFIVSYLSEKDGHVGFKSDSWVELKQPVPQKCFQGFRYVGEL